MPALVDSGPSSGVTQDAQAAFDYTCRHYLEMSGDEFLRKYDAGYYNADVAPDNKLARVLAMLPFAR